MYQEILVTKTPFLQFQVSVARARNPKTVSLRIMLLFSLASQSIDPLNDYSLRCPMGYVSHHPQSYSYVINSTQQIQFL